MEGEHKLATFKGFTILAGFKPIAISISSVRLSPLLWLFSLLTYLLFPIDISEPKAVLMFKFTSILIPSPTPIYQNINHVDRPGSPGHPRAMTRVTLKRPLSLRWPGMFAAVWPLELRVRGRLEQIARYDWAMIKNRKNMVATISKYCCE